MGRMEEGMGWQRGHESKRNGRLECMKRGKVDFQEEVKGFAEGTGG